MANTVRRAISASRTPPHTRRDFAGSPTVHNELLAALPREDGQQMIAKCERIYLTAGDSLYESGAPTRFVYFPAGCFASLVASTDRASAIEVALIGTEGMLGMWCMLDVSTSPFTALVQGTGSAWRMEVEEFRRQIRARPALSSRLALYLHVGTLDLAQMVACARFHLLEPRLARWLLMMSDRAHSHQFDMTQMLVSHMLGVRRSGVSVAAASLQQRGLISYFRGRMTIRERRGLERTACSCYARARESYERYLG